MSCDYSSICKTCSNIYMSQYRLSSPFWNIVQIIKHWIQIDDITRNIFLLRTHGETIKTPKHLNTNLRGTIRVLKYMFLVPTMSKLERGDSDGHLTIPVKKILSRKSQSSYTAALPDPQRQKLIHNQRLAGHLLSITLLFDPIIWKIKLEIFCLNLLLILHSTRL